MKISSLTRRDIFDSLMAESTPWCGRLEEPEFLSRIFDLSSLPSTDHRFEDASGDVWQHRVNNPEDWPDDWILSDARFNLAQGDDEVFCASFAKPSTPLCDRMRLFRNVWSRCSTSSCSMMAFRSPSEHVYRGDLCM